MSEKLTAGERAQNVIYRYIVEPLTKHLSDANRLEREIKKEIAAAEQAAREDERAKVVEECAEWWDDTEARSAEAHDVYQQEAHLRGDVRHADAYEDLSEDTKEWDRVLVRWVATAIRALARKEPVE